MYITIIENEMQMYEHAVNYYTDASKIEKVPRDIRRA